MIKETYSRSAGILLACLLAPSAIGCTQDSSGDPDDAVDQALAGVNKPAPLGQISIPTCRLADTRGFGFTGPYGTPSLVAGNTSTGTPTRDFPVAGCNIPTSAKAISVRLAVIAPDRAGFIGAGPANGTANGPLLPLTPVVNYPAGGVTADAAVVLIGAGAIRVFSEANADLVIDVTGYFEEQPQPPIRITPAGPIVNGVQSTAPENLWQARNNICRDNTTVGATANADIAFTNGEIPAPPLGTGSFQATLVGGQSTISGASIDTAQYNGLRIQDVSGLRYSTRSTTVNNVPYVAIDIDSTGGNTRNHTIRFIPANNQASEGSVSAGVWQTWDAAKGNWNLDGAPGTRDVRYSNDFSVDVGDYTGFGFNGRPNGTITRNSDSTATAVGDVYTKWNGYRSTFPTYGYTTRQDFFIDVTNPGRFDFSSAINNQSGSHLRDFVFSAGASGTANTWFVSAGTGAPGNPSAPDHAVITSSGFYTFESNFHDDGRGNLAVHMAVKVASTGAVVHSFDIATTDNIATTVGGNRYGWILQNDTGGLKIDNQVLSFNDVGDDTIQSASDFSAVVGGPNDFVAYDPSAGDSIVLDGQGHADVTGSAFTRFGGNRVTFPTFGYTTSLDVYVDTANTGQYDYASAINNKMGTHLRDFIFTLGASGTPGTWFVSVGTGSPGNPAAPDHATITASGWYTLESEFHDNGNGVLVVDMRLERADGTVVKTWQLGGVDNIAATVGGPRYGWILENTVPVVKIDNAVLTYNGDPNSVYGGPDSARPLSTFNGATILNVRIGLGCFSDTAGVLATDDVEIGIGGSPGLIYDFERN